MAYNQPPGGYGQPPYQGRTSHLPRLCILHTSIDRHFASWRLSQTCINTSQSPTASSHSINKDLPKATGNLQCNINSIHHKASTALLPHSSNGVNLHLDSMVRRRLTSTVVHPPRVNMELHLSSSNGASRLLPRVSMVHLLQASTVRRRRVSMVHRLHKANMERHHLKANMGHPLHKDSTVRRHRASISRLLSSSSMDLQTNPHLDMGHSRPPTLMSRGMLRLFARP